MLATAATLERAPELIDGKGERPLIKNKKVVLKNDYIHHVIDIYNI